MTNRKMDGELETNRTAAEGGPVTAIVVGAGHRSMRYAGYAKKHPDKLAIVGVVEPDPVRRQLMASQFGLADSRCYESLERLVSGPKIAQAAINGTMDRLHVETTIPLLEAGYDILLEKPISTSDADLSKLAAAADKSGKLVMVCHVLRYAPFYRKIKERLAAGTIGDVVHIQTSEHVSYHHMAVAYIRGKWNSVASCNSSMLMAKCCHDLDIIAWLAGDIPASVSSFGSLMQFKPENAPAGAGTRCLQDCLIEESCQYSAKKHYLDQGRWGFYVWENAHLGVEPDEASKIRSLASDNPYGRCVWHCDNDVVDHQSVIVEFGKGGTAAHSMIGATAKPSRTIHIVGTKGEISGIMEEGFFTIRTPDARKGHEYAEMKVEAGVTGDSHGGGDMLLVDDFVKVLKRETPSLSFTSLDTSIFGHRIGFAAERSRLGNRVEPILLQR